MDNSETPTPNNWNLREFTGIGYDKGGSKLRQITWMLISGTVFTRWWCPASVRVAILRRFGARIGDGVLIRHRVQIHWPWKLSIGDGTWIGENTWILNLEDVQIGNNVCISQSVFICTGSHDRKSPTFEFDNAPILIEDNVWIAAQATVLRGVTIGARSTVGARVLVVKDLAQESIVTAPIGILHKEETI
ncbi:putative colanic acid biosynthesis acetyltransferase [Rhodococcus sp. NPDC060090]|uniref:putative colanic acid biosynthesis acetyltransferase n=1 Tax=Rhodococcus sp. NPDC060090 TaxID=3347056 RepID=UPI00364F9D57